MRFHSAQAQHTRVAQLVSALLQTAPAKINGTDTHKSAGAVRYNVQKGCAGISLCRALRRVNRLCSSTVSDTANRLRKTRKKKSSAVPLFRSGHMSAICARLSKGKAGVQRGRETAGVPSFLPLRRAPHVPALRRAQLPLNRRRKPRFNIDFTRKHTLYLNLTNSRFCILQNFRKIIL